MSNLTTNQIKALVFNAIGRGAETQIYSPYRLIAFHGRAMDLVVCHWALCSGILANGYRRALQIH